MRGIIEAAAPIANPVQCDRRPIKPLTSRLRKSKNFHKEDRMLDDYLDRTKLLNNGEKRTLRKLLKLRQNEDSNKVKVTISGLKVLLGVDIKTVRRCLIRLVEKGFLINEGIVWDPGFNYSKKVYSFPTTFPGFDLATVFIRKGDMKRYKARLPRKVEKGGRTRKVSFFSPKNTYPISTRLVDCSSHNIRRTWKNSEDTNVSSKFIPSSQPQLAAPTASSCASLHPKKGKDIGILSKHPQLRSLIQSILSSVKCSGQVAYVSRFIDALCDENITYLTEQDRVHLCQELYEDLAPQFLAGGRKKKITVRFLFEFLRDYINLSMGPSFYRTSKYYDFRENWWCGDHYDRIDEFQRKYPWCSEDRSILR